MRYLIPMCIWMLLAAAFQLHARHDNVWIFGHNGGVDFNSGTPVFFRSLLYGGPDLEASASICNEKGELLFYTNGTTVWDRNNRIMPSGDGIVPQHLDPIPTGSTAQGTVIVPFTGQPGMYYIFSKISARMQELTGNLYYSVVDMSLNNGMGDIVPASRMTLLDTNLSEHMAVVAGDRCNYWLVNMTIDPAQSYFRVYGITDSGIVPDPVVSPAEIGNQDARIYKGASGHIAVSNRRDRLALTNSMGPEPGAVLYDFDPVTGRVSNPFRLLDIGVQAYGVCFSEDDRRLYVNAVPEIIQYNMELTDLNAVAGSGVLLGRMNYGQLRPAPDGKIYFAQNLYGAVGRIGVIHHPERLGTACSTTFNAYMPYTGTWMYLCFSAPVVVLRKDTIRTARHINPSCFYRPLRLEAQMQDGWGYQWQNGASGPSFTADSSGVYHVRYYTAPCNFHEDSFYVSYPDERISLPELHTDSACPGASDGYAAFSPAPGDTSRFLYAWMGSQGDTLSVSDSLSRVPAGNYTVYIKAGNGCDTILSVIVPEYGHRVAFGVSDSVICAGDVLEAFSTSATYYTDFEWQTGDGGVFQDDRLSYPYEHEGRYELKLTGSGPQCRDSFSRMIQVDAPVRPLGYAAAQADVCAGHAVEFSLQGAAFSDKRIREIRWDAGAGMPAFVTSGTWSHHYPRPGIYNTSVSVSFRRCPDTSLSEEVKVHGLPLADLGSDTAVCFASTGTLQLRNRGTSGPGYTYLWEPSGPDAPGQDVNAYGRYILTVADRFGCASRDTILIEKGCGLDIPNVFSPNGDGYNDYFFPSGMQHRNLVRFRMQVFSRWGQEVYAIHNPAGPGWDGKLNGQPQGAGVYIYQIEAEFASGVTERYQGNVTLLR